jgi:ribosomal protein L16 Arg81 hydroxylase
MVAIAHESSSPSPLEELFRPLAFADFIRDYFDQKPLHLTGRPDSVFTGSLTSDWMEQMLRDGYFTYPSIRLISRGEDIETETYVRDIEYGTSTMFGVIDPQAVLKAFGEGVTIIINAVNRHNAIIRQLCRSLAMAFRIDVNANAYLTPPRSAGTEAHYDNHDVLIIQIAGSKHWTIHEPVILLPLRGQKIDLPDDLGDAMLSPVLHPGDLLYLPRGYIHAAATADETSIHVTVAIAPITWYEVLREALEVCRDDEEFRRALSPASVSSNGERRVYESLLDQVRAAAPFETVIDRFRAYLPEKSVFPHGNNDETA